MVYNWQQPSNHITNQGTSSFTLFEKRKKNCNKNKLRKADLVKVNNKYSEHKNQKQAKLSELAWDCDRTSQKTVEKRSLHADDGFSRS